MKSIKYGQNLVNSINKYSTKAPVQPHLNPKLPNRKMFINNEWVDSLEPGNYFTPINPTTGQIITEVQSASKKDLEKAVEAAKEAFYLNSIWRKMNASNRGRLLFKLSDLIERDIAYITSLETVEIGKLFSIAYAHEMKPLVKYLRSAAGMTDKLHGHVIPVDGDFLCYTRYEPVGVCGLINAWNFPTVMAATKLALSLATGNTVILKPSQHACLPALHIAELVKEAGFPPGVINVLPGVTEIGKGMANHPEIDLLFVTSSTETGQDIYRRGASNIKRLVLELSGKSAIVICDDIDLDFAVRNAHFAIFHNAGQCCCAASITYVQDTIYEEFVKRSIALTRERKIGEPFDPTVMHGPQANKKHLDYILKMVEEGKNEGGTLEVGGGKCDREGFFMEPAIFTNVRDHMKIFREEILGPVQMIIPFKNLDEVIERVNDTKFGLASCILCNDVNKINTFTQRVRAGNVWVNCYFPMTIQAPFGGYKMSGLNKEGGIDGYKAFTEEKCVQIKLPIKIADHIKNINS